MNATERPTDITEQERRFQMARRQAIIIELGAIEDYLGIDRSIVPRRKREPTPVELRDKFARLTGERSCTTKN